jgi:hypothetical protein
VRPRRLHVEAGVELRSRATPAGVDFAGAALPSTDARALANATPLSLKRGCAWGVPGGSPYRGTVEQALLAAGLPADAVRALGEKAERGWSQGQVEISRSGIRTLDGRRHFDPDITAMGFSHTLCFNTRVNFKPGHVEYAALYEHTDSRARTYTVMVPSRLPQRLRAGPAGRARDTRNRSRRAGELEPGVLTGLGLALGHQRPVAAAARRDEAVMTLSRRLLLGLLLCGLMLSPVPALTDGATRQHRPRRDVRLRPRHSPVVQRPGPARRAG